jgi:hypothetical protein
MCSRKIISSVDAVVTAMCLDYKRREKAIRDRSVTKRTDTEYRYLNYMIYDAAAEIIGERDAVTMVNEIGSRTGYAKSSFDNLSEITYKNYKRLIMDNVAKKLHLVD